MTRPATSAARRRGLSHPMAHRIGIALAIATLGRWLERSAQRRALSELDDHRLRDIGITRQAAGREARRPFWS